VANSKIKPYDNLDPIRKLWEYQKSADPADVPVNASIFADCFPYTGTIDAAAPGPVGGWTFIEPFGALGGEFNFTPGIMSMDTFDADDFAIAVKPLTDPLSSVFDISGQFDFTEYSTPPNPTTTYQVIMNNSDISESLSVSLFGDGNIVVQAGDSTTIPTYTGTWTPDAGAHVVHFTIDALGIPRIWIDGIEKVLAFLGNVGTFFSFYPANNISWGGGAGDVTPDVSPLRHLFLTAGVVGPETIFSCPV